MTRPFQPILAQLADTFSMHRERHPKIIRQSMLHG
jgi:hypothetical protein